MVMDWLSMFMMSKLMVMSSPISTSSSVTVGSERDSSSGGVIISCSRGRVVDLEFRAGNVASCF